MSPAPMTDPTGTSRLAVPRAARLAVLLAALAGCSAEQTAPTLQRLTLAPGTAYAAVGIQQRLAVTGVLSDGSTEPVATGLTWTSSDPAVAAVDANGVVTPWSAGSARITASHAATGLSATTEVVARAVVSVAAVELPATGRVDTGTAIFRATGLVPGAMYAPAIVGMTDDVDLAVYSDLSLSQDARLCASINVGRVDEACVAPANADGELWITIDGEWTQEGATFGVAVPLAPAMTLAGTLAYPAALPYSGSVGTTRQAFALTGLAPGAKYEVRISDLTDDVDLQVFADAYRYRSLCESFLAGTVDDACDAVAGPAGELFVELDGETTPAGGSYRLAVTPR